LNCFVIQSSLAAIAIIIFVYLPWINDPLFAFPGTIKKSEYAIVNFDSPALIL
jgi:hypothetical protein